MAMCNHALRAALRPDCLLAVFPVNGGTVINPLSPEHVPGAFDSTAGQGSWAGQNGLLETGNIAINEYGFAPADPSINASLYTSLDLQGNTTSKTFIAKGFIPSYVGDKLRISPLISQGSHAGTGLIQVFRLTVWSTASSTFLCGNISNGASSMPGGSALLNNSDLNKTYVFAMSADYESIPGYIQIRLYINGVKMHESQTAAFAWHSPTSSDLKKYVAVRTDNTANYLSGSTVCWAMIFDSVLTPEEIQAFR